jgi:hypothetical protein
MSDATTHLLLPYILAAQAQKHVTHNEALRLLDGLVQLSVLDRDLTAPPGSPTDGDRYIVGSGATGDWAGWDLNVALWTDGAWLRLPPRTGWRAWVEDEGLLLVFDGAGWIGTTPAALQNLSLLGLGTTADASNPFSAKLNAALWTAKTVAEGGTGDLFYTMNKEAAGDDLGLTLQTGFVTKALVGLFGSDRFRLAVSADGSTFFDGLSVDNANRHRRSAPAAAVQGVHQLRQLRRRRDLDEDRHQQHRLQRPGRVRCRQQPLRGASGRHLPLRRDAALQGERQHVGADERAARAERHDRDPRLVRRDQRRACLRGDGALAADDGRAHRRRHRRTARQLPRRGRLLRRRPDVLLGHAKIG